MYVNHRSRHRHYLRSSIIVIVTDQYRRHLRHRHRPSPVQAEHLSFSFM
jgi:hypothetical protein